MLPDFNDPTIQTYLVGALWSEVAPFAYLQFLANGLGAIFIDLNDVEITPLSANEVSCKGSFSYKTVESLRPSSSPDSDTFRGYDPETDVCLFRHRPHRDEPEYDYRNYALISAKDHPTPKNLLEAKSAVTPKTSPVHFETRVVFNPSRIDIRSPQFQLFLIRQGWSQFAFMAFDNYKRDGRGALLIDLSKTNTSREFATTQQKFDVGFVGISDEAMRLYRQIDLIRSILEQYDPEAQAVFVFTDGVVDKNGNMDVSVHIGPIGRDPSPRNVFDAQKNVQ